MIITLLKWVCALTVSTVLICMGVVAISFVVFLFAYVIKLIKERKND